MERSQRIILLRRISAYITIIPFIVVPYNRHLIENDSKKTIPYGMLEFVYNEDSLFTSETKYNQLSDTVFNNFNEQDTETINEPMIEMINRLKSENESIKKVLKI